MFDGNTTPGARTLFKFMKTTAGLWTAGFLLGFLVAFGRVANAVVPAGFAEETIGAGWSEAVGVAFGKNASGAKDRLYVWERGGRVWIVEDGMKLAAPLIDISDEVGAWRDYGLLGFALDPGFQQNGFIYLFYVVDRHHLL